MKKYPFNIHIEISSDLGERWKAVGDFFGHRSHRLRLKVEELIVEMEKEKEASSAMSGTSKETGESR